MRFLATYILSGPMQAVSITTGFALLAYMFPILILFSGGALVLVALHNGMNQSIKILLGSFVIVTLITFFIFGKLTMGPLVAWVSILLLTYVYRNTRSLNLSLQLLVVFGCVSVIVISLAVPDLQSQWLVYLQKLMQSLENDPAFQRVLQNAGTTLERLEQSLPLVASLLTGGLISLFMLVITSTLFLGRWWHGLQANAKAFREEFIRLTFGKVIASLAVLFALAGLVDNYSIFWQLALVCLSMFVIQGMAVAHTVIANWPAQTIGFICLYGFLLFATLPMSVTLSAIGVLDSFLNFRKKFLRT